MTPTASESHTKSSIFQGDSLPLFIGITGHRDLRSEDVELLAGAVHKEIENLRTSYPHTPLALLSPLGEGADRLVARVALTEGLRLIVPLPLPRDLYEASFSDDSSRAEFSALLQQADAVFTLPWIACGEKANSTWGEPTNEQIEGQYAAMGAYLARYSHVLLALWDGDDLPEHERIGGTAHIVRLRLQGAAPPYGPTVSSLEHAGYGVVHHILTPRQSRPQTLETTGDKPYSLRTLPLGDEPEDFGRIDVFNADVQKSQLKAQAQENARSLVTSSKDGTALSVPENLRFPVTIYGWADTLSTVFARQMARTTQRIFLLVFFAALSFNLFHSLPHDASHSSTDVNSNHLTSEVKDTNTTHHGSASSGANKHTNISPTHESSSHEGSSENTEQALASLGGGLSTHQSVSLWNLLPWFLWAYLGLVAVNIKVHGRAEKQEFQTKYQDYRALAEGLRVQIFWRVAGLREDVSDHYLGKQRGELNWIRHAIKSCNVLADAQNTGAPSATALPLVVQLWAQEQRNYYVRKAHREQEQLEKQEKLIRSLVALSVLLTLILGLVLSLPSLFPIPFLEPLKHMIEVPLTHALLMICIVMLAVTAGLLHGYNALLARSEHSKRYGRMATLFQHACSELDKQLKIGHSHKATILLHELGREALAENGDWVLLHRERPLEVPHAG